MSLPLLSSITFLKWQKLSILHWHCHIFKKVNFVLSESCNNENKSKVTLRFPLAKGTFN